MTDPSLINWRDIPLVQRGWIGECDGYIVEMKVHDRTSKPVSSINHLSVWLKEPKTICQISFLSLNSNHPLNKDVFISCISGDITVLNISAVDPLTERNIPIIVCDTLNCEQEIYVGLPLSRKKDQSICSDLQFDVPDVSQSSSHIIKEDEIIQKLIQRNCGGYKTSSKLRDWLVSRQRFWGTPIPIVYCSQCGIVPVPEKNLPVELPKLVHTQKSTATLRENEEWYSCCCPK